MLFKEKLLSGYAKYDSISILKVQLTLCKHSRKFSFGLPNYNNCRHINHFIKNRLVSVNFQISALEIHLGSQQLPRVLPRQTAF